MEFRLDKKFTFTYFLEDLVRIGTSIECRMVKSDPLPHFDIYFTLKSTHQSTLI
jgi:hypothetical protein